jgi:ABC-type glutathione transport system ATPase component
MSTPNPALRVRDLTVRDRTTGASLIEGVSFEAMRGEAIGIVGDSGAGKSTLALALMGLLSPGLERASTTGAQYVVGGSRWSSRSRCSRWIPRCVSVRR